MAVWPSIKINISVARCQNLFNIVPEATEEWLETGDNNKTIRYVSISSANCGVGPAQAGGLRGGDHVKNIRDNLIESSRV